MTDGRCNSDVVYGDIIAWQGSFHSIVLVLVRVLETERGDMIYWRKQYGGEERRGEEEANWMICREKGSHIMLSNGVEPERGGVNE